jgi:hypothetical protein
VLGVTITQTVSTIFMGALNGGQVTLIARAGALMPPCTYLTNTANLAGAYTLSGTLSGNIYPRCPMYINQSILMDTTSSLTGAEAFNVTGASGASLVLGLNCRHRDTTRRRWRILLRPSPHPVSLPMLPARRQATA